MEQYSFFARKCVREAERPHSHVTTYFPCGLFSSLSLMFLFTIFSTTLYVRFITQSVLKYYGNTRGVDSDRPANFPSILHPDKFDYF